jgi:adenylosuccinate lyase
MVEAISPIDGRYSSKTSVLSKYFSEFALIQYRIRVEIEYFICLCEQELAPLPKLSDAEKGLLREIYVNFNAKAALSVKEIEKTTNHDVKAVEYYIKDQLKSTSLETHVEFIHFGLTSQDINNTAIPMSLRDACQEAILPELDQIQQYLIEMAKLWKEVPMLARTHGQPASPTGLGKELFVFADRLHRQLNQWKSLPYFGKFGGATGNFNAHFAAYPNHDWNTFGTHFLQHYLGLQRYKHTTQIEHYDGIAECLHSLMRVSNILMDLCRDIWTYISFDYFKQKTIAGEIGSSAMPHKVNPIDFENAEGNLGITIAMADHLANKLPISRLQRDLTDSTVLRNLGVPFAHFLISLQSISKGISKLTLNDHKIKIDLQNNWPVVAEAIQNILRREGYAQPYEALKDLTRGKVVTQTEMHQFIDDLLVPDSLKIELKQFTPENYTGDALHFTMDFS